LKSWFEKSLKKKKKKTNHAYLSAQQTAIPLPLHGPRRRFLSLFLIPLTH
jgi:hypothetical protein